MEAIVSLLTLLSTLSPLAVIALLGVVIFMLVKGKTAVDEKVEHVSGNHLSGLPEMAETLKRIETSLQVITNNIIYIRARLKNDD